MSWNYILSQILTVAEYIALGWSYFAKRRRLIVTLDIVSMSLGVVAYFLLGADLGAMMSIVILLANFYYLWDEKRRSRSQRTKLLLRDYIALGIVLSAIAVLAWLTYDGPLSLLSVLATTLYEISIWQKSTKVYKFLGIPVALCWMLYNGLVFSVAGLLSEAVMFVAAIVGYLREYHAEKLRMSRRKNQQKSRKQQKNRKK